MQKDLHTPDSADHDVLRKEHSLIIVSGTHLAKMFEFENGTITPQPVVHVDHTEYTDVEGFRGRDNSPAGISGTPSNNEKKDTGEWHDFVKNFEEKIAALKRDNTFDYIYLFAPQEAMNQIREILPKDWQEKLRLEHSGNFTKAKPHELEELIKSELGGHSGADTWTERAEEAMSILGHPKMKNGNA